MTSQQTSSFTSDWAVPPGAVLLEALAYLGMSQAELARRADRPLKTINEIVKGKTAITAPTALQLERVLGIKADIWNKLEANYRAGLARLAETELFSKHRDWVKRFPLKEMEANGFIAHFPDRVDTLRAILNFFGVSSTETWEKEWATGPRALFRQATSFPISREAVAVWLRAGERQALTVKTGRFSRDRFLAALSVARRLTSEQPHIFEPLIKELLSASGVNLVLLPELPGTRVSGATRWLTSDRAVIQLSLRYKTDDHFWFTLFHEAAHLILHGRNDVFLEGVPGQHGERAEEEANHWAADFLIPRRSWQIVMSGNYRSRAWIEQCASSFGIASGIIVGRLQHEELLDWKTSLNQLKAHFTWAQET